MMFFLFYILPIIIIGFITYISIPAGQTIKEYIKEDNDELAVFVFIPIINLLILFVIIVVSFYRFIININKNDSTSL